MRLREICAGALRRLRYGRPIVVVSGLPRSGTSMAMRMLEAGGVEVLTDHVRPADAANPHGYYELEAVKGLDKDPDAAWLAAARGKAVKIVSHLITWLPEAYNYQVIFLERSLHDVIASQNRMLVDRWHGGEATADDRTMAEYERHLARTLRFLQARRCFTVLRVQYEDAVSKPRETAQRVADFLGRRMDVDAMAAVVDPALHRHRQK
jgi:hypothetical protein